MDREIERHLRWLMVLRLVTVSTLLLSVFIVDLFLSPARSPVPIYVVALFTYVLCLGYGLAFARFRARQSFLVFQLMGDAVVITAAVYLTGGPDSPFSFLYLVVVLAASVVLTRRAAFGIVAANWLCYAGMVGLVSFGWAAGRGLSPDNPFHLGASRLIYLLVVHFVGFFLAAVLASYVSENLRRTRAELLQHRDRVAQLQTYHENIIGSITSGLITTDARGRVDFVNPGAEPILERPRSQLLRNSILPLLGRGDDFLVRLREELEVQPRVRFEDWIQTGTERRFLGFTVSKLRDKTDRDLGYVFSFQDLTDRKALEEEIQLKEHMAAIGGVAARMAHEIRNPLASISGSVQLLKRELAMEESHRELMQIILKESRRLDDILNDFLSYARPGSTRPQPVDMVGLVRETVQLLRNSEECRNRHRIVTRFRPASMPAVLRADRIRQVIWNLARNGLKAMPEGGTLTIGVEERADQRFAIFFEDEGIGMSVAEVENCFEPFRGGFERGTGLGLSIVYRVVEEHGGRVQIRSASGQGTRVEVLLPVGREALMAAEA